MSLRSTPGYFLASLQLARAAIASRTLKGVLLRSAPDERKKLQVANCARSQQIHPWLNKPVYPRFNEKRPGCPLWRLCLSEGSRQRQLSIVLRSGMEGKRSRRGFWVGLKVFVMCREGE